MTFIHHTNREIHVQQTKQTDENKPETSTNRTGHIQQAIMLITSYVFLSVHIARFMLCVLYFLYFVYFIVIPPCNSVRLSY